MEGIAFNASIIEIYETENSSLNPHHEISFSFNLSSTIDVGNDKPGMPLSHPESGWRLRRNLA